jgi:GTP-binding protein
LQISGLQSAIPLKIEATFVRSVADAAGLPRDGLAELAVVGRSNVGKSTLINALVGQRVARTSAAPGKTRLANLYRITRGAARPFYLVDLPGYGFAGGGRDAARAFDELTRAFFGRGRRVSRGSRVGYRSRGGNGPPDLHGPPDLPDPPDLVIAALLLVDARHPGLESDRAAWEWLHGAADNAAIVATKIDKLARGERIRALKELESAHEYPVVPVSAATGEGLDDLWKAINRLVTPK